MKLVSDKNSLVDPFMISGHNSRDWDTVKDKDKMALFMDTVKDVEKVVKECIALAERSGMKTLCTDFEIVPYPELPRGLYAEYDNDGKGVGEPTGFSKAALGISVSMYGSKEGCDG